MQFTDEQLDQLTSALFDDAVISNGGIPDSNVQGIQYEQLKAQLIKHPGLLDNLCKRFKLVSFLLYFFKKLICCLLIVKQFRAFSITRSTKIWFGEKQIEIFSSFQVLMDSHKK